MGRTRACQQICSTPLHCLQIIYPSPSLSPPISSLCGTDRAVFITPVISCCSVSTFPGLVELAAAADIITRLAASPQFPCSLPSSSPFLLVLHAQQSGRTALVSRVTHQGRAQVSGRGACTCANPVWVLSKAAPPWCQHWNVIDMRTQNSLTSSERQELTWYSFILFIVCLPIFIWPNTKEHCCTGAQKHLSCSLGLLGFPRGTYPKPDIFTSM